MKFFLLPVALSVSLAAAQTSSACGADYIVDACLTSETAKFNACDTNDWDCKCYAYDAIVTCFNNCPNDSRKASQDGQRQIFCGYASQYPSKTASGAASTPTSGGSTAATTTGAVNAATTTGAAHTSATGTGTASAPSSTGGAADLALNAGGVLAVVAAVVAAVL